MYTLNLQEGDKVAIEAQIEKWEKLCYKLPNEKRAHKLCNPHLDRLKNSIILTEEEINNSNSCNNWSRNGYAVMKFSLQKRNTLDSL